MKHQIVTSLLFTTLVFTGCESGSPKKQDNPTPAPKDTEISKSDIKESLYEHFQTSKPSQQPIDTPSSIEEQVEKQLLSSLGESLNSYTFTKDVDGVFTVRNLHQTIFLDYYQIKNNKPVFDHNIFSDDTMMIQIEKLFPLSNHKLLYVTETPVGYAVHIYDYALQQKISTFYFDDIGVNPYLYLDTNEKYFVIENSKIDISDIWAPFISVM